MDYVKGYENYLSKERKASQNTLISYLRDVGQFVHWLEAEGISPEQAMQKDTERYIGYLVDQGKAASTVARALISLKSFYRYMTGGGYITVDPARGLTPAKEEQKLPQILSIEEVDRFLEQPDPRDIKGRRDRVMLELLYATGIKVSELTGLDIEHVNLTASFIRCVSRRKERMIPLYSETVQVLQNYIAHVRPKMVESSNEQALFVNMHGERMSRQGFWKIIKHYQEKAGISKDITPHMLRHSFVAHLLENGADLRFIQQILGHAGIPLIRLHIRLMNQRRKNARSKIHR